jgi:AcrR family transcriptional regulator
VKPDSLRERTRQAMKAEVAAVAVRLFVEHGFEAVTTSQIAAAAGISPRSFFRYFPTKEDVLLGDLRAAGERVKAALEARPARESAWEAITQAFRVLAEQPMYPAEEMATMARIIVESPSIRARDIEKHQEWETLLAPGVAKRMPGNDEDAARAVIATATSVLRIATERWLRGEGGGDPHKTFVDLLTSVRA